jgi:hypothetical protein
MRVATAAAVVAAKGVTREQTRAAKRSGPEIDAHISKHVNVSYVKSEVATSSLDDGDQRIQTRYECSTFSSILSG